MIRRTLLIALLTLAVPAAAQAHVTLQPTSAPAGAFTRLDVRVPNERDDASTNKIDLQMPPGFAAASYEPVEGWSVKVTKSQLETPIQTPDGEITEGVTQITWTADDADAAIAPGAFRDFGLSVQIPGKAGDKLEFKALQTYDSGEVVRWIGAEDSDNPAAIVTVIDADAETTAPAATPTAAAAAPSEDGDGGNTLAIVALIVGALGVILGLSGALSARRSGARA
jgi:uncharacterized protein YcnI